MNIITTIQSALTALNNTADLFMLEKSRAENEELNNTTDTIIVYPDWRTTNQFTQSLELSKTRVYNIDFKTPDEWDNSDGSAPSAYESKTSADRIEDMEVLADSVISYISAHNDLFPEITQKLKWTSPRPILRANNGTMSGVTVQLTIVFSGERVCDYITTPVPVIPFPNPDDLNTWHKTITEKTFAESIVNLPAKFLPRVAEFNGVDDHISIPHNDVLNITNNFSICFEVIITDLTQTNKYFLAKRNAVSVDMYSILWEFFSNSFEFFSGAFTGDNPRVGSQIEVTLGRHDVIYSYNGTNWIGYLDGAEVFNLAKTFAVTTFTDPLSLGSLLTGSNAVNMNIVKFHMYNYGISSVQALNYHNNNEPNDFILGMHPTGQGDYEYDISVNNNHGAWSGTGTRFDYDLEGSTYPNTHGYSLWQLAANPDIQAPFDINGLPLSLTPGVNIKAGYTKTRDIIAGGVNWNMADALVDFDPDSLGSAEVAIFDRSNVTRQTAASRASLFYDAANPYRYQINEIADPRIYDTFFESLFQNIIFGRIVLASDGSTDVIRYDEELNYKTQREGDTLAENIVYCRFITNIYP